MGDYEEYEEYEYEPELSYSDGGGA